MVESEVVEGVLGALIVKVDLLVAVELALELVGCFGGRHASPELLNLFGEALDFELHRLVEFSLLCNLSRAFLVHLAP